MKVWRISRWVSALFSVLFGLGLLALPVVALAQGARPTAFLVGANVAADLTNIGLIEIQAAPTGKGIIIFTVQADVAAAYTATVDSASLITSAPVVLTQAARFGTSLGTSIVRTGLTTIPSPIDGGWILRTLAGAIYSVPAPLFVPPGRIFTIRRVGTNAAMNITIGYYEVE
jgi:hypothetical protein